MPGMTRGADFVQSQDGKPEVKVAFEDEHDYIPAADALALKGGGGLVGVLFHVAEGEMVLLAGVVAPEHGRGVGLVWASLSTTS